LLTSDIEKGTNRNNDIGISSSIDHRNAPRSNPSSAGSDINTRNAFALLMAGAPNIPLYSSVSNPVPAPPRVHNDNGGAVGAGDSSTVVELVSSDEEGLPKFEGTSSLAIWLSV
jgi:hypothetical protein